MVGGSRNSLMQHKAPPAEAAELFTAIAKHVEAVDQSLDEAHATIVSIIETYAWESWTPDQRLLIKQWHTGIQSARVAMKLPQI